MKLSLFVICSLLLLTNCSKYKDSYSPAKNTTDAAANARIINLLKSDHVSTQQSSAIKEPEPAMLSKVCIAWDSSNPSHPVCRNWLYQCFYDGLTLRFDTSFVYELNYSIGTVADGVLISAVPGLTWLDNSKKPFGTYVVGETIGSNDCLYDFNSRLNSYYSDLYTYMNGGSTNAPKILDYIKTAQGDCYTYAWETKLRAFKVVIYNNNTITFAVTPLDWKPSTPSF